MAFAPEGDIIFIILNSKHTCLCLGRRHYILHDCLPYKHPGKDSPAPRQLVLLLVRYAETWEKHIHGELSSTGSKPVIEISILRNKKRRAYLIQNKLKEESNKGQNSK